MQIAPSILAADLADLASALQTCERGGADWIHVDVMDGHFVPNLSFGVPVVRALAARTQVPLDVHLMVANPDRLLDDYLEAGAKRLAVHLEATPHLDRTLTHIHASGCEAGVAINPATPVEALTDIVQVADFVLVMSVNPGFGGQKFVPYALDKVRRLKALLTTVGREIAIEIDGGVSPANIRSLAEAGVDCCVVGSALFGSPDPAALIGELKRLAWRKEERR